MKKLSELKLIQLIALALSVMQIAPPAWAGDNIQMINNQPVAVVSATTQTNNTPPVAEAPASVDPHEAGPLSAATLPPLPSGYTRAASNVNFAFQTVTTAGITKLKLMNLTSGAEQTLVEVNTSAGLSISAIRDVSADGKTAVYGYTLNNSTDYVTVVQDLSVPTKKATLSGNLQTIEFLSVSGNYGNSPYPGSLVRITYIAAGVTQTSIVDNWTMNALRSIDKKNNYELQTNEYAYFVMIGSYVTVVPDRSVGHPDKLVASVSSNGSNYFHFVYTPRGSVTGVDFYQAFSTTTKEWRYVTREEFEAAMLPAGWMRATSNPNFAFQLRQDTYTSNAYLYVMDLVTGVSAKVGGGSMVRHVAYLYDVSPDGKTVVVSYSNPTLKELAYGDDFSMHKMSDLMEGLTTPILQMRYVERSTSIQFTGQTAVLLLDDGRKYVFSFNAAGGLTSSVSQSLSLSPNYSLLEYRDSVYTNGVLIAQNHLKYDPNSLSMLTSNLHRTFHPDGIKVKTSEEYRYVNGLKTKRYYREYDAAGVLKRLVNQTYHSDGITIKASADYLYANGLKTKRYYREYDTAGVLRRLVNQTYHSDGIKFKAQDDYRYVNGLKTVRYNSVFDIAGGLLRYIADTYYADGKIVNYRDDYQYTNHKRYYHYYDTTGTLVRTRIYTI